jgi:glutamyl-tRNA reductase
MFMVDIAVPRDIEPEVNDLEDVYLYTVDDLESTIEENRRARQQAAQAEAEQLIEQCALSFYTNNAHKPQRFSTAYRQQVEEVTPSEMIKAQQC